MPGNVALAAPTTVLPVELSAVFTVEYGYPVVESGPYADGRSQRRNDSATSHKAWTVSRRLTATEWATVLEAWDDLSGPLSPAYFYPNRDDHDPTGASETGRAIVRFDGALTRSMRLSRCQIDLRLLQIE
jgi:hypothetical protein